MSGPASIEVGRSEGRVRQGLASRSPTARAWWVAGGVGPEPMHPGDEAPAGTPGTGENLCDHCNGTGRDRDGEPCPVCDGTGKVITGIGGG